MFPFVFSETQDRTILEQHEGEQITEFTFGSELLL